MKWKGWSHSYNELIHRSNLNCDELIAKFSTEITHFDKKTGALWLKSVSGAAKPPWVYWPAKQFKDMHRDFLKEQKKNSEKEKKNSEFLSDEKKNRKRKNSRSSFSSSESSEEEHNEISSQNSRPQGISAMKKTKETSKNENEAKNDEKKEMVFFIFSFLKNPVLFIFQHFYKFI